MPESPDEYCSREVRLYDPDRWLTALFAPDECRPGLLALYAFNSEIARARESVTQPMIGQIRLQWWREAWDGIARGNPRQHPVVLSLNQHCSRVDTQEARWLIDARERDMDPAVMPDMASLTAYAESTSAPLMRLATQILGVVADAELRTVIRSAGTGYALTGLMRATSFLAAQQRVYLPADGLAAAGLEPEAVYQKSAGPALFSVVGAVATEAEALIRHAGSRRVARRALPAVLPATLGRLYLRGLRRAGNNPDAPAVTASATRKHIALMVAAVRSRL